MIVVDYNQIFLSNILRQLVAEKDSEIDEGLVRHLVLNSISSYIRKFKTKYQGPLIIACDGRDSWRKEIFPNYKANRDKKDSKFDWPKIFSTLNLIREELKTFFPYPVIHIDGVEADDIIAFLCKENAGEESDLPIELPTQRRTLIVSRDKDFYQLHGISGVSQYDPIMEKSEVVCPNPVRFLYEHILRGDDGDGIPNYRSDDDVLVTEGKRQMPVSLRGVDALLHDIPKKYDPNWIPRGVTLEQERRNYKRNQALIDFTQIPDNILNKVRSEYEKEVVSTKERKGLIMGYMIQNRLRNLIEKLGDFNI